MPSLKLLSDAKCFGGQVQKYSHQSKFMNCEMKFNVFIPPGTSKAPCVYFLSGLTCTEDNFFHKAGAFASAAKLGLALIGPDTSYRGVDLPGDSEHWDFGKGAGFYVDATTEPWKAHANMYSYITRELPECLEEITQLDTNRASIFGHSMGGHGALTIALKNPGKYRSCSAFAPIVNPTQVPWGIKAFSNYLGGASAQENPSWKEYDSCELIKHYHGPKVAILVDQGSADSFLERELKPERLVEAAKGQDNVELILCRRPLVPPRQIFEMNELVIRVNELRSNGYMEEMLGYLDALEIENGFLVENWNNLKREIPKFQVGQDEDDLVTMDVQGQDGDLPFENVVFEFEKVVYPIVLSDMEFEMDYILSHDKVMIPSSMEKPKIPTDVLCLCLPKFELDEGALPLYQPQIDFDGRNVTESLIQNVYAICQPTFNLRKEFLQVLRDNMIPLPIAQDDCVTKILNSPDELDYKVESIPYVMEDDVDLDLMDIAGEFQMQQQCLELDDVISSPISIPSPFLPIETLNCSFVCATDEWQSFKSDLLQVKVPENLKPLTAQDLTQALSQINPQLISIENDTIQSLHEMFTFNLKSQKVMKLPNLPNHFVGHNYVPTHKDIKLALQLCFKQHSHYLDKPGKAHAFNSAQDLALDWNVEQSLKRLAGDLLEDWKVRDDLPVYELPSLIDEMSPGLLPDDEQVISRNNFVDLLTPSPKMPAILPSQASSDVDLFENIPLDLPQNVPKTPNMDNMDNAIKVFVSSQLAYSTELIQKMEDEMSLSLIQRDMVPHIVLDHDTAIIFYPLALVSQLGQGPVASFYIDEYAFELKKLISRCSWNHGRIHVVLEAHPDNVYDSAHLRKSKAEEAKLTPPVERGLSSLTSFCIYLSQEAKIHLHHSFSISDTINLLNRIVQGRMVELERDSSPYSNLHLWISRPWIMEPESMQEKWLTTTNCFNPFQAQTILSQCQSLNKLTRMTSEQRLEYSSWVSERSWQKFEWILTGLPMTFE